MRLVATTVAMVVLLGAGYLLAAEEHKGEIKRVDATTRTITVTIDGKDKEMYVSADTTYLDAQGNELPNKLKSPEFRAGAKVSITSENKDGKEVASKIQLAKQ